MCVIHRIGKRTIALLDDFVCRSFKVEEYDKVEAYIAEKKIRDIKGAPIKTPPVIEAYKKFEAENLPKKRQAAP